MISEPTIHLADWLIGSGLALIIILIAIRMIRRKSSGCKCGCDH